jgi:hypothetical protein
MEHLDRSRLQQAEREWRESCERALAATRSACALLGDTYKDKRAAPVQQAARSPVRAVYWPLRYTPPPRAPRCARALVGFTLAILAPIVLVLLHKAGLLDRPSAVVLLFLAEVIGLYLTCTATE